MGFKSLVDDPVVWMRTGVKPDWKEYYKWISFYLDQEIWWRKSNGDSNSIMKRLKSHPVILVHDYRKIRKCLGLLYSHEFGLCKCSHRDSRRTCQEDYKKVAKQGPHANGAILLTQAWRYRRTRTRQHLVFSWVDWNVEVGYRNWKSGRDVGNGTSIMIPSIYKRRTYGPSSAYFCWP